MNKQEFELKYREIVLKTNGGIDDYIVALCQIGSLINELDEPSQEIAELKKQLEEKDKAIEMLKSIDRYDIGEMLTENIKLKQAQNQKAVEELSNLKAILVNNVSPTLLSYNEYVNKVFEMINNQIRIETIKE